MGKIIPEKYRTKGLPPEVTDLASLRKAIVTYLDGHERTGCSPVRHVYANFHKRAVKYGTTIRALIGVMCADGEIAVHYFESLRRTYVFSGSAYSTLVEMDNDPNNTTFSWLEFGKELDKYGK